MKILNKIWSIGLLAVLLTAFTPRQSQSQAQGGYVSNQVFYDELSPYGTWVYDDRYGDVWIPDAEDGFRPYGTRGHWVLTEYGNTWVSDYPWGWATFHYGRWIFDDYYGWMWAPDGEWGPAWVNWRQGGGYYGWAPLGPGISLNVSIGSGYSIPDNYWNYAPEVYINSPRVYDYYVPRTQVVRIVNRTTIINNTVMINNRRYVGGPRFDDIRRVTRSAPQVYQVNNARRPGSVNITNNTVNIYKPNVTINKDARPARVVDGKAYRNANPDQRIAGNSRRGADNDRANAARLAAAARSEKPDDKIVRVNNNDNRPSQPGTGDDNRRGNREPRNNNAPNADGSIPREQRGQLQGDRRQPNDQQRNTPDADQNPAYNNQRRQLDDQQGQQQREIRRQQAEQRANTPGQQPAQDDAQRQQQNQEREQQRQQRRQEQVQRGQQPAQDDAQRQQKNQEREQQRQQRRQQQQMQLGQQQQMERQQQGQQDQQAQFEQQRRQQQTQRDQQRQQEQQVQRDQQRQQQQMERQQQRQQEQQTQRDQQRQQQQMERQQRQQEQQQRQQEQPQAQPDQQMPQRGGGRRGTN